MILQDDTLRMMIRVHFPRPAAFSVPFVGDAEGHGCVLSIEAVLEDDVVFAGVERLVAEHREFSARRSHRRTERDHRAHRREVGVAARVHAVAGPVEVIAGARAMPTPDAIPTGRAISARRSRRKRIGTGQVPEVR